MKRAKFPIAVFALTALWWLAAAAQDHMSGHGRAGIEFQTHTMDKSTHRLHMAARQGMLTQKMAKELLLVALGFDEEGNSKQLQATRGVFARTLLGLRHGDQDLLLMPTTEPDVLDHISQADELWPLLDAVLSKDPSKKSLSAEDISVMAELNVPLMIHMIDAAAAYETELKRVNLYSMLTIAIKEAEGLGMLTQKMAKEYLLIAYGHAAPSNQKSLAETVSRFDRTLDGLINGNLELRLMAAPNSKIKLTLLNLQRHWFEVLPALTAAVESGHIGEDEIGLVARNNMPMLELVEPLVNLYEAL